MSIPPPPPAPPKSFPYDHLFKLLMIGDAGVGKVRNLLCEKCALLAFEYNNDETALNNNPWSFYIYFCRLYTFISLLLLSLCLQFSSLSLSNYSNYSFPNKQNDSFDSFDYFDYF